MTSIPHTTQSRTDPDLRTITEPGAKPSGPPRDRLLDAAAELFYREGVGVGVERICQTAGVSKRSMYQLFDTKDELIAESLRQVGVRLTDTYVAPDDADRTPRDRIMRVFRRLEDQAVDRSFAGCPFVSTTLELKDHDHEAVVVAVDFKDQLTAYFAEQAREAGLADAAELAEALTAAFDGSSVRAVMRNAPLRGLSLRMAEAVLNSYGLA